jgi:hypothetical protein
MPEKKRRFRKQIIRPGKYDGHDITLERIKHWESQFNRMREKGFLIPCPYFHDQEANPVREPSLDDANTKNNAGFWDKLEVDEKGILWGEVEAVDEDAAKVIGKAARQCSLAAPKKWKQGDEEWNDPITHIALTNKAKAPTGDEFVPVVSMSNEQPYEVYSLEMLAYEENEPDSVEDANSNTAVGLDTALDLLGKHGIALPDDTSELNFLDRLITALTAIASNEKKQEGGNDLTKKPEGSKTQKPSPIAMSHELELAVELLNSKKLKDPETNQPFTVEGLKAAAEAKRKEAYVSLSAEDQAKVKWAEQSAIKAISSRVQTCVDNMQVAPARAKEFIDRLNEDFRIEFSEDGQQRKQWFDYVLEQWETNPRGAVTGEKVPMEQFSVSFDAANMRLEQRPQEGNGAAEMTEEEAEKLADEIHAMG